MSESQRAAGLEVPFRQTRLIQVEEAFGLLRSKGIEPYDVARSDGHFDNWCDKRGYTLTKRDPAGKQRGLSQIWYREYEADPLGQATCPPYQNFWHWLLEQVRLLHLPWTVTSAERSVKIALSRDTVVSAWVRPILDTLCDAYGESFEMLLSVSR